MGYKNQIGKLLEISVYIYFFLGYVARESAWNK